MWASIVIILALASVNIDLTVAAVTATRPPLSTLEPSLTQIISTQATQEAISPVSNILGVGFDRIVHIWLENLVCASNPSAARLQPDKCNLHRTSPWPTQTLTYHS
jgi:hypothetical protein